MIKKIFRRRPECAVSPDGKHEWLTLNTRQGTTRSYDYSGPVTAVSQRCTHCKGLQARNLRGTWPIEVLNEGIEAAKGLTYVHEECK